ncbi:MAG: AraC family transcriptional regulator of adaptative response [Planctomycetota bacterium]|jgi:AraC family transcriptional regulator of adaptative response/methylated-DNA-[protein]-cysteine methyltransferase
MDTQQQLLVDKFTDLARYIIKHADETLPLSLLAERVTLSASRFQRVFKSIFGVTPKKFQQAARSDKFREMLRSGKDITTAIVESGYGSTSRVYGNSFRSIGMTPKAYRKGGRGEIITHACRNTVLGPLMMAATDRGVCFAQFGDSCDQLLMQLQSEFPQANLIIYRENASLALEQWIESLNRYMDNQQPRPDIPLDLKGTAFQVKVWQFLLEMEEGEVASYCELATAINSPKAFRAAASACAANRIAVLVPCHRILRSDGSLGGYRWGIERKRALLDRERRSER